MVVFRDCWSCVRHTHGHLSSLVPPPTPHPPPRVIVGVQAPRGGFGRVSPSSGTALSTPFEIAALGWTDDKAVGSWLPLFAVDATCLAALCLGHPQYVCPCNVVLPRASLPFVLLLAQPAPFAAPHPPTPIPHPISP
jgi:hypothetical protein